MTNMTKWIWIALGLGVCAALVDVGVSRPALIPRLSDLKSLVGGKKAGEVPTAESVSADQLEKAQESVAESIARQQELSQQVQQIQQSTLQSMAEVQRTLKSIEDINRINRQTQQLRPPPNTNR